LTAVAATWRGSRHTVFFANQTLTVCSSIVRIGNEEEW
jgi:hypothetical protein